VIPVLRPARTTPAQRRSPARRARAASCWPATPATAGSPTRYARNRRLADALYQWAFSALLRSPGARALYDHQRARGATHHAALRALANRLVGILHGCLRHGTAYNENTAWPRLNVNNNQDQEAAA
jgi:hypothetical protein